jgi:hypothetical protein
METQNKTDNGAKNPPLGAFPLSENLVGTLEWAFKIQVGSDFGRIEQARPVGSVMEVDLVPTLLTMFEFEETNHAFMRVISIAHSLMLSTLASEAFLGEANGQDRCELIVRRYLIAALLSRGITPLKNSFDQITVRPVWELGFHKTISQSEIKNAVVPQKDSLRDNLLKGELLNHSSDAFTRAGVPLSERVQMLALPRFLGFSIYNDGLAKSGPSKSRVAIDWSRPLYVHGGLDSILKRLDHVSSKFCEGVVIGCVRRCKTCRFTTNGQTPVFNVLDLAGLGLGQNLIQSRVTRAENYFKIKEGIVRDLYGIIILTTVWGQFNYRGHTLDLPANRLRAAVRNCVHYFILYYGHEMIEGLSFLRQRIQREMLVIDKIYGSAKKDLIADSVVAAIDALEQLLSEESLEEPSDDESSHTYMEWDTEKDHTPVSDPRLRPSSGAGYLDFESSDMTSSFPDYLRREFMSFLRRRYRSDDESELEAMVELFELKKEADENDVVD